MPCGCSKRSQGDGKTKQPTCTCQQLAANIGSCCKGGKQPPSTKETSCYCKPAPPKQLEAQKSCKCDETAADADLDAMMDANKPKPAEKPPAEKPPPSTGDGGEEGKPDKKPKPSKDKDKGKGKSMKFSIRLSPEQLAATCTCGEECDCPFCTCKPESLWKCENPEDTEDCCVQLVGAATCKKRGKEPAPLKYYVQLTPAQLALTCDCEEECECELCTCKLKLKSCKILCLRRFKGKKTCKCVCFKSLDADGGGGGGGGSGAAEATVEEEEEEEEEEDDGDYLGDAEPAATPQVSCKCKYIKAAVAKVQEKRKPCGPPPPACCPKRP